MPLDDAASLPAWMRSAAFPRIVPFAAFMLFVIAGHWLAPPLPAPPGEWDTRWLYAARALVVGLLLALLWPRFIELRSFSLRATDWAYALVAGAGVFLVWIVLDEGWVAFSADGGFDPRRYGSETINWPLAFFRLLGLAVVVPLAEELFWRSFLMRWLERQDFLAVAPARVGARALIVTSVLFALEHTQWLAGLMAGAVYGWIYMRTGKLWVPLLAHALTNALLGGYILMTRDWRFW